MYSRRSILTALLRFQIKLLARQRALGKGSCAFLVVTITVSRTLRNSNSISTERDWT
jgi:hypothetical protein